MRKFEIHKKSIMTHKIQTMMGLLQIKAQSEHCINKKYKHIEALRLYPKKGKEIEE